MTSSLTQTFGVWLITFWLQTLLQGCGMLQVWLYFHWYKNDSWGIKAMVLALLVTETFQSIVYFHVTYIYLIDGFGDTEALKLTHWQDTAQLIATYLSAFTVQMYFGHCIYILDQKNKILPGIIAFLALTQIAAGTVAQAQTIRSLSITSFSQLDSTKVTITFQAAAAFLCDIVITVSLVYLLGSRKTGLKSTNTLLGTLIINAINRGTLTAVCSLINMILFLARPGTFYFFIGLILSGKLYMNSALASLNSREHVVSKARRADSAWDHISMDSMVMGPQSPEASTRREGPVNIVVTKQSETIIGNTSDFSKLTFVDGMV